MDYVWFIFCYLRWWMERKTLICRMKVNLAIFCGPSAPGKQIFMLKFQTHLIFPSVDSDSTGRTLCPPVFRFHFSFRTEVLENREFKSFCAAKFVVYCAYFYKLLVRMSYISFFLFQVWFEILCSWKGWTYNATTIAFSFFCRDVCPWKSSGKLDGKTDEHFSTARVTSLPTLK